jgi:Bacterial Ig domain
MRVLTFIPVSKFSSSGFIFSESSYLAFELQYCPGRKQETTSGPEGPIMKYSSLHPLTIVFTLAAALCAPLSASAACPAPASGKLVICQPTPNSRIYQVPHIEALANPLSGSIVDMKVYIDGHQIFENAGPELSLFEGGVSNGTHHLSINAWDGLGRLYHADQFFAVTGNLPSCPVSTAGVRICAPASGQVVSQNLGLSLGFKGNAPIKRVTASIAGTTIFDFAPASGQTQVIADAGNTTAGTHTLNVVAVDANNVTYKASAPFTAYFEGDCPPKGDTCNPGIYGSTPNDGDDVESPFRVSASVQNNTHSITAMKVYVDGAQVAQSSGPSFDQPVSAAKGTHVVTIQAWDTAGKLYRLTENVNVE